MAQFNILHTLTPELFFNVPMSEQRFLCWHLDICTVPKNPCPIAIAIGTMEYNLYL